MNKMKVFSNPEKEYAYRVFCEYFDYIKVQKVRDDNNFSIYMARLPCLLLNEQRYLVLMAPRDNYPPSHVKPMEEVRWVSLQTRTLTGDYSHVIEQNYELKRNGMFEKPVLLQSRSKEITIYEMGDLPLTVSLLHVRGGEYEYPNEGTLNSALETFRTIVQFKVDA